MKTLFLALTLVSTLAWAKDPQKVVAPIQMTGHEVNGIDRGRLNITEEDKAELSTMKAIDNSTDGWQRRMKETVEEISWW